MRRPCHFGGLGVGKGDDYRYPEKAQYLLPQGLREDKTVPTLLKKDYFTLFLKRTSPSSSQSGRILQMDTILILSPPSKILMG